MSRIGYICPSHGYIKGNHCPYCAKIVKGTPIRINTQDWVAKEDWSDIQPGLKVSSKTELIAACERTGNYARAFMKPKSQGQGWDHKRRGA